MNRLVHIGVLVRDGGAEMGVRGWGVAALIAAAASTGCAQASDADGRAAPVPASLAASTAPPSSGPTPSALATLAPTTGATSAAPSSAIPATTTLAAQAIPWLDQPVAKVIPPDDNATVTHPVLYRPCAVPDLTARAQGWGAGMGTMAELVHLTNASATPCTLAGSVVGIVGIEAHNRIAFALQPGGMGQGPDPVANLLPGETGWMQITQGEACATDPLGRGYPKVGLELPGGGELVMTTKRDQSPQLGCELGITPFGTTHVQVPEPTYPTDPIKVSLTAPSTIPAGTAFDYTVRLANPTTKAISLTPCPSYEETAFRKPDPHPDDATYQLNCDGHHELAAHESLTFAMHMAGIGPTGQAQIFWQLQQSNVFAGAWLTVT